MSYHGPPLRRERWSFCCAMAPGHACGSRSRLTASSIRASVQWTGACWRSRTARSSMASRLEPTVGGGGDLVVNTSCERLPGDLHGPVLRGSGRAHDLSVDRQLRPHRLGRPDRAGRGCAASWSRTPPRPCSSRRASWLSCCVAGTCPRSAAWTRAALARRLRETGAQRVYISAPGRDRRGRGGGSRATRRRAGRSRTSSARCLSRRRTRSGRRTGRSSASSTSA